ncbi:MAG TPA: hypothetical protein PLN96_05265 [Zoogloea sp.]|nr:hypothetical protein [Zoogloea sp.]HNA67252.1 hypothetical protein [Rhodocyclaceae bacterium]HNE17761.1 hypothetical protein [Rhodocyclaceae bacterium]HNI47246.1 hypothetical protein [Zoogloea sp.]
MSRDLTIRERLNLWFWWLATATFTGLFWLVVITGVAWLLS